MKVAIKAAHVPRRDALFITLPGYQIWLRFIFLREGDTPEKRDGMRAFLATTIRAAALAALNFRLARRRVAPM